MTVDQGQMGELDQIDVFSIQEENIQEENRQVSHSYQRITSHGTKDK